MAKRTRLCKLDSCDGYPHSRGALYCSEHRGGPKTLVDRMGAGGEPAHSEGDIELARKVLRAESLAAEPSAIRAQAAAQLWALAMRYVALYPEHEDAPPIRIEIVLPEGIELPEGMNGAASG